MSRLKYAVAAVALTIAGQGASASTFLDYQGKAGYGNASVWGDGPDYNGIGAAFKMNDASNGLGLGKDFIAFCVDLLGYVGDDKYAINNTAPFDPGRKLSDFQKTNVENLFQASYAGVDVNNNIQAAAFQLALWEAAYETDEAVALSLQTGNRFGSSTNGNILATAQTYLANLTTWDGTQLFQVNFLDADNINRQDLVMATPVPVPAAGLLLIGGIGALGLMKRRKDKRAA